MPVPGDPRQIVHECSAAFAYSVEKSRFAHIGSSNDCDYSHLCAALLKKVIIVGGWGISMDCAYWI